MRKTYWVLYQHPVITETSGHSSVNVIARAIERLKVLLSEERTGYSWLEDEKKFYNPILMTEDLNIMLQKYGTQVVELCEPVWSKQIIALKGFMSGKKDVMCKFGVECRRNKRFYGRDQCRKAHEESEMIPEVWKALSDVDARAKPRLVQLGFMQG